MALRFADPNQSCEQYFDEVRSHLNGQFELRDYWFQHTNPPVCKSFTEIYHQGKPLCGLGEYPAMAPDLYAASIIKEANSSIKIYKEMKLLDDQGHWLSTK